MKNIDIEQAVKAVLTVLKGKTDQAEVDKLKGVLPKHIKDLIV